MQKTPKWIKCNNNLKQNKTKSHEAMTLKSFMLLEYHSKSHAAKVVEKGKIDTFLISM